MSTSPDDKTAAAADEIHLIGVPPLANFVDNVKRRAVGGHEVEESVLIEQWRNAAVHYQRLEDSEAGLAEQAGLDPMPPGKADWIERLKQRADFAKGFRQVPIAFAMVELDRLLVYQQHVSLPHVDEFTRRMTDAPSREDALFEICLPLEPHPQPIRTSRSGRGRFVFQSELSDIRAFTPRFISEETAQTVLTSNGPAPTGVVIPVGFGIRHINIVRVGKRMVLNNGYHRAYALRSLGITQVPAVIQAIAHPEELAFAGGSSLIDNFEELFKSPRPPLFKDFFDPNLTTRLQLLPMRKQIQVTITIETLRVPD